MLQEKGWIELELAAAAAAAAAAEDWFQRQQREMMQTAQMPRPQIPGPPPPPPQRVVPPLGHVQEIERLKSEIAALTKDIEHKNSVGLMAVQEIERLKSEIAAEHSKSVGMMAVQIDAMTVQIRRNSEVIERLIAALEQRDTAAAAGRQTGVPSQSGGDITRRTAYVSSSNEGFLECTRPGPDSSEQPENQASAG